MCWLLRFNKYLLVPLVTEWLDLYDFLLLSSSVTRKCSFAVLLGVLQSYPGKIDAYFEKASLSLSGSLIMWLDSRKLYPLLNIQLDDSLLDVFQPETFLGAIQTYIFGSDRAERKRKILNKRHYVRRMVVKCSVDMEISVASSIASNFTKLQELTLTRHSATYKKNSNWMNNSFIYLLHLCPHLRKLHVDEVIVVPDQMFFVLVVWCRKIESLSFPNRWMSITHWRRSQLIYSLHSGCPIRTAVIPEYGELILKTQLAYFPSAMQSVTVFENYFMINHLHCSGFDLSSITSLHIDFKYDSQIAPLLDALPGLKELFVDSVHQTAKVESLLSSGLPIVHLHCKYLPMEYLQSTIASSSAASDCLSCLTSLDLSYYGLLKDEVLSVVASRCSSLTQLNLSYNSLITDEGVLAVIVRGRLVRLNVMITYLTAKTLRNLVEYCPSFQYLGMSVSVITEQDVFEFVARCSTLRELFCYVFQASSPPLDQRVRSINSRVKVLLDKSKGAITGRV